MMLAMIILIELVSNNYKLAYVYESEKVHKNTHFFTYYDITTFTEKKNNNL